MLLHDPIGDSEADAGSAYLTASRLVHTVKAFEDLRLILLRDSESRIAHGNDGHIVPRFQKQLNGPGRAACI